MTVRHPTFSDLPRDETFALLERNHVGRLAFTFHDRVDIEPISYVFANDWVYARTSEGTKLSTIRHHPWVAFEVDEVTSRVDWRSVVVRGTIYFLDPERGEQEREEYNDAAELLRSIDHGALTDADDTPFRHVIFRIHADEVTGRRASSR